MLLLAGASGSAMAIWSELQRGGPEGFAIHIDPATIRRVDSRVKMWVLFDYKTAQMIGNQPYLSERTQDEYDCEEEQFRMLGFSNHSEHMAAGRVVLRSSLPGDWMRVEPGTANEVLWKFACSKQ